MSAPDDAPKLALEVRREFGAVTHVAQIGRGTVDLSCFCAAPSARLSRLPFEGDRAFPTQC